MAGRATRLGALPFSKELYPVGFGQDGPRAVCTYLLRAMAAAAVCRAFLVLRPGKWDIPAHLGDGRQLGLPLAYLSLEASPGVPWTLDQAYGFVRDHPVVLGFPDILFRPRAAVARLVARQQECGSDLVLGLFPGDRPDKADMVVLDAAGRVCDIEIKPGRSEARHTWILAVWSPAFTEFLHAWVAERSSVSAAGEGEPHLGLVFLAALAEGLTLEPVVLQDAAYVDVGTPEDLERAASFELD
jgi:glucose-1-phosphate thymidylyltransferase